MAAEDVFDVDLSFSESEDSEEEDHERQSEGEDAQIKENKPIAVENPSVAINKNTNATNDIDKDNFDTHKFCKDLVNEKPIQEILNYSNNLTTEIKALDSDMQMLVYENYNKFISATDTIREMKTKVETMEEEMEKLFLNMDKINKSCKQLETKFHPNRQKIEKLVGVRRLLKRLEFLFELPKRLRHSIEIQAYEQAVKNYKAACAILEQHRHEKSFEDIFNEAKLIVSELNTVLRNKVKNGKESEQFDAAVLLRDLGIPMAPLRHDILATSKKHFEIILHKCEKNYNPNDEIPFIIRLTQHFVTPFVLFARRFREVFIDPIEGTAKDEGMVSLTSFTRNLFCEYFTAVKRHDPFLLTQDESYLKEFYEALHAPGSLIPRAGIRDRAGEIVELSIRTAIARSFAEIYESIRGLYTRFLSEVTSTEINLHELEKQINDLMHNIVANISEVLCKVQEIQDLGQVLTKWSLDIAFIDHTLEQLKDLMHSLYRVLTGDCVCLSEGDVHSPNKSQIRDIKPISEEFDLKPLHLLLLSKVCYQLADRVVPKVVKAFKQVFANKYKSRQKGFHLGQSAKMYEHELMTISIYCKDSATALRTRFVETLAASVINCLDAEEGNRSNVPTEEDFRPVMLPMIQMFDNVISILSYLYELPNQRRYHEPVTNEVYRSDFDRLFGSRSYIFGEIRDQPGDILCAVCKVVFKAWSEILRETLITKELLEQIQKETNLLRHRIPKIIPEDEFNDLESILDEIKASAKRRTVGLTEQIQEVAI